MEKSLLYLIAKITAVIASITILNNKEVGITNLVISTLSFACVFVLELLLDKLKINKKVIIVTIVITMITCFTFGMELLFPLFVISLVHLLDMTIDSSMYYSILIVAVVLSILIFIPDIKAVTLTFLLLSSLLFSRLILLKMHKYREVNEEQKETMIELNKKIADMRSLTKTIKYSVSLEERNRIAARIHDQLGHGISGSILLLEAAMLIMKDNPEKANSSIQKAIGNLRNGVDEIRASLREERAGRYLIGINDITTTLEEFKYSYNKSTVLHTSGDMEMISLEIWACIHDNLKECLTNLLKHSNATEFHLNIEVFKKIIKVEYKDNGTGTDNFEKGLGLDAIEERTINSKGRCFFTKGEKGFSVTNIFTY